MHSRFIITLECIDEGNAWGLTLGQTVYYRDKNGVDSFAQDPWRATLFQNKENLSGLIEKILDDGDFMPAIKTVTMTFK